MCIYTHTHTHTNSARNSAKKPLVYSILFQLNAFQLFSFENQSPINCSRPRPSVVIHSPTVK